jgi:hypothetical protein
MNDIAPLNFVKRTSFQKLTSPDPHEEAIDKEQEIENQKKLRRGENSHSFASLQIFSSYNCFTKVKE